MSIIALMRKPFVQEGLRVALIMGAGDAIAQSFGEKKTISEIDIKRTLKFAGVGFFFVGPCLRIWYSRLERLVSPDQKPFTRGLKKMAIDQLAFAPVFCAAVISVFGKVNLESNKEVLDRLKKDYPQIMLRNYMIWPIAQVINFSLVPLSYQVLFAQFVALFWNAYISLTLNKM